MSAVLWTEGPPPEPVATPRYWVEPDGCEPPPSLLWRDGHEWEPGDHGRLAPLPNGDDRQPSRIATILATEPLMTTHGPAFALTVRLEGTGEAQTRIVPDQRPERWAREAREREAKERALADHDRRLAEMRSRLERIFGAGNIPAFLPGRAYLVDEEEGTVIESPPSHMTQTSVRWPSEWSNGGAIGTAQSERYTLDIGAEGWEVARA